MATISRRQFLDFAIGAGLFAAAAGTAYPVIRYLFPPLEKAGRGEEKITVATLEELPPGRAKPFKFRNKPFILLNTKYGITALSLVCTHLACIVKWDETEQLLKCPCHAGFFDPTGKVLAGPPPRPLPQLKVMVREGQIMVGGEA